MSKSREEKEGFFSILVSALSAWTGLGAGLALLGFSLLAVLGTVYQGNGEELGESLRASLGPDLASVTASEPVEISEDGQELRILRTSSSGTLVPVIYVFSEDDKVLYRESTQDERRPLGPCNKGRFRLREGLLEVIWYEQRVRSREVWALKRWGEK